MQRLGFGAALPKSVDEAQPARHRQEIEQPVFSGVMPHAEHHRVDRAVLAGKDRSRRAGLQMIEHLAHIERLPAWHLGQKLCQLLGHRR